MPTKIEWADESWTPIRARNRETGKVGWYCEHATPGCESCYSEAMNRRLGTRVDFKRQNRDKVEIFLDEEMLSQPLRWKRPRRIFVCSMTDLFAEFVPDEWIERIVAIMALCPQHIFLLLTKRAARMRRHCANEYGAWPGRVFPYWAKAAVDRWGVGFKEPQPLAFPLPNVHLGVSVEDQPRADERIPELLATPAAVRWISAEPLLGPVDLRLVRYDEHYRGSVLHGFPTKDGGRKLNWVVAGSESGPAARPCDLDWVRGIRDQCSAAGVAFFWKQHAERGRKISTPELDGKRWVEYPAQERG
jgi:protein gp37